MPSAWVCHMPSMPSVIIVPALSLEFGRIPDRGGDVALRPGLLVPEVIHGDHLAVPPLHAPRVADVPAAAVAAEHDLVPPRPPAVAAQAGPHGIRRGPTAVGQTDAAVREPKHARGITLA